MKNTKYLVTVFAVLVIFVLVAASCSNTNTNENTNTAVTNQGVANTNEPEVASIKDVSVSSGDIVTSPLNITGKALGTWYFEASFPVKLTDNLGNIIVQGIAQAQSDWMTEDFVAFEATLEFTTDETDGILILSQDDPSGLFEVEELSIPVNF